MVGARVRRQQVAYAQGRGLSSRRACALLSVARSTLGYVSRLVARDAPVVAAMRTLAAQYPRYGYRQIRIFLERQGHGMSADRDVSALAPGGAAGAAEAAAPPRRDEPPAAPAADGDQSRVGIRFRLRRVRRWPHAEMPDRHRRVHARMPGDRRRRQHSIGARHRGPEPVGPADADLAPAGSPGAGRDGDHPARLPRHRRAVPSTKRGAFARSS